MYGGGAQTYLTRKGNHDDESESVNDRVLTRQFGYIQCRSKEMYSVGGILGRAVDLVSFMSEAAKRATRREGEHGKVKECV